jgi:hypothetical protein
MPRTYLLLTGDAAHRGVAIIRLTVMAGALALCAAVATAAHPHNRVSTMNTTTQESYTTTFTIDQTPAAAFAAICNVRGWWSGEVAGTADRLGAEFTYRVPEMHYSKQKVTEFVPGRRIVWHVLEADLTFVKDRGEWQGTDIVFEITPKGPQTEVRFTHRGLVPSDECFDKCSPAWSALVNGNLRRLIATGEAQPSPW